MFERATKHFTDLSKSEKYNNDIKSFGGAVLATEAPLICEHENVWTWTPSDVEELTIVRMPHQIYQGAETIMVVYEKFFHKEIGYKKPIVKTWYCDCTTSLDSCLKTITDNHLL